MDWFLYDNQSIDLLRKPMDWFLYDNGLRHERVNNLLQQYQQFLQMEHYEQLILQYYFH